MVQLGGNLEEALRVIFENPEIYVRIEAETEHHPVFSGSHVYYQGPQRVILHIKVKQRQKDFESKKESWDEAVMAELINGNGVYISRSQSFNQFGSDMISDYVFHVYNLENFNISLLKYAEDIYNKRFTVALESKLSED